MNPDSLEALCHLMSISSQVPKFSPQTWTVQPSLAIQPSRPYPSTPEHLYPAKAGWYHHSPKGQQNHKAKTSSWRTSRTPKWGHGRKWEIQEANWNQLTKWTKKPVSMSSAIKEENKRLMLSHRKPPRGISLSFCLISQRKLLIRLMRIFSQESTTRYKRRSPPAM